MEWMNYHHLLYFWTVAKEGSIVRACDQLRLAQPTVSAQIRALEESLGDRLFLRVGRRLVLTEFGRMVYSYADEIFGLGRELLEATKGRSPERPLRLIVGISDSLPKSLVHRLLMPALEMESAVHLICHEDHPERLLAQLATMELDVALTDAPSMPAVRVKTFNHLLGTCGVTLFAAPALAKKLKGEFPESLKGAPMLLPLENSTLRRSLDHWLEAKGINVRLVGEFQDSALAKAFGQAGLGIFAAPSAVEDEVRKNYGVVSVGRISTVVESYYAISVERKFKHPALLAIQQAARQRVFAETSRDKNVS
ncbi:MAG: transcriptional activator NhaR [Bryobacteraceae bacterium]|nr:transcriptional activator NhaR [Bryobacteraceae bacterium]